MDCQVQGRPIPAMTRRGGLTKQRLRAGSSRSMDPERVVMTLIVVNAVTLGLETSQAVMARWGTLLHVLDQAILAVFVIELLGRMALQRTAFFRDGWNVFDFHGDRRLARARDRGVHGAARAARAAPVAADHGACRRCGAWSAGCIGALPGMGSIVLLDRPDLLRLRRHGGEPVRRGFPRPVRHAAGLAVHAASDHHDAGRLGRRRGASR